MSVTNSHNVYKKATVRAALKDFALIVAGCVVMMSGPILSGLGLLKG